MQTAQLKTLEAARRVQTFLDARAALLGNAVTQSLRDWLDIAVDQFAAFQLEQELARAISQWETVRQTALRHEIHDRFIHPIGTIAHRALRSAQLSRLAKQAASGPSSTFAGSATLVARAAEPKETELVGHGMPADFVGQFRGALAELVESVEDRGRYRNRHAWATSGLRENTKAIRAALAVVDAVLKAAMRSDRATLAEWAREKRFDSARVRVND
jgi:hypothetical protein